MALGRRTEIDTPGAVSVATVVALGVSPDGGMRENETRTHLDGAMLTASPAIGAVVDTSSRTGRATVPATVVAPGASLDSGDVTSVTNHAFGTSTGATARPAASTCAASAAVHKAVSAAVATPPARAAGATSIVHKSGKRYGGAHGVTNVVQPGTAARAPSTVHSSLNPGCMAPPTSSHVAESRVSAVVVAPPMVSLATAAASVPITPTVIHKAGAAAVVTPIAPAAVVMPIAHTSGKLHCGAHGATDVAQLETAVGALSTVTVHLSLNPGGTTSVSICATDTGVCTAVPAPYVVSSSGSYCSSSVVSGADVVERPMCLSAVGGRRPVMAPDRGATDHLSARTPPPVAVAVSSAVRQLAHVVAAAGFVRDAASGLHLSVRVAPNLDVTPPSEGVHVARENELVLEWTPDARTFWYKSGDRLWRTTGPVGYAAYSAGTAPRSLSLSVARRRPMFRRGRPKTCGGGHLYSVTN
jgi:hypothetical protein